MKNLLFGSSGSLGSSIVKIITKKYKKKKIIYISRTKPLASKGRWYKFDLNNNINKFKYKKLKCCIFLASPHYLKKNMKFQTFNKEYLWIKKIHESPEWNEDFTIFAGLSSLFLITWSHLPLGILKKWRYHSWKNAQKKTENHL